MLHVMDDLLMLSMLLKGITPEIGGRKNTKARGGGRVACKGG